MAMFFDATTARTATEYMFSDLDSLYTDDSVYLLVWIPIGVVSAMSLYSNAVECYNFVAAWNMIARTTRADTDHAQFREKCMVRRRLEMEKVLKTKPYDEVFFPKETVCPVCLGEFKATDLASCSKKKSRCKHLFHQECLKAWLSKHPSCPCCRYEILRLPDPPPHPLLVG